MTSSWNVTGFDSAWTPKNRGALATIRDVKGRRPELDAPTWVTFLEAHNVASDGGQGAALHLVAIDQPLVVRNASGSRAVDRAAGSVLGRYGGGVQSASRARSEMFGAKAPIWGFLRRLKAGLTTTVPGSRSKGVIAIEVFPALGNLGLFPEFQKRGLVPKYNPTRKTFCLSDWNTLCTLVAEEFGDRELPGAAAFCEGLRASKAKPPKQKQDFLDAMLCLLTGLIFLKDPSKCAVLGDERNGFMVVPVTDAFADDLDAAAKRHGIGFHRCQRPSG